MHEMDLVGVRVELPSNNPIVLLKEQGGEGRILPIFIGSPEATAIAFALEEVEVPRPLTHDLLQLVLDELNATLQRIVVTDLKNGTFFAELHLHHAGQSHRISCRPSDAVALASRVGCPIFADSDVLDEAGIIEPTEDIEEADEVVEEFKEFIDNVDPEDFAS